MTHYILGVLTGIVLSGVVLVFTLALVNARPQ